jgi:hypothetical protein
LHARYILLPLLLLLPLLQVLYLSGANRPGLLTALSAALRDLGLEVSKAIVETDSQNNKIADKFFVTRREGGKVMQVRWVEGLQKLLRVLLLCRCLQDKQLPIASSAAVCLQQSCTVAQVGWG